MSETERVSEVVHIQTPVWFRPVFAVSVVLLSVTMFLFGVGSWLNGIENRHAAEDARAQAADARAQVVVANAKLDKNTASAECRSQKQADLNAVTSDLTGTIGTLIVLVANRDNPQSFGPVLAQLQTLAEQRAAAAAAARTAVDDCKGP